MKNTEETIKFIHEHHIQAWFALELLAHGPKWIDFKDKKVLYRHSLISAVPGGTWKLTPAAAAVMGKLS